MEVLQTLFVKTKGAPVKIGNDLVVQMDIIPVRKAIVTVTFISEASEIPMGIALKSNKGEIYLSNKKKEKTVYIWNLPDLPKVINHEVTCPDGILKVWNIYQITVGEPTHADFWTNNAGMIIEIINDKQRKYYCSDGIGAFNKQDLVFQLEWEEA